MDRHWQVDLQHGHDLSLPIDPGGEHPRFFCAEHASARPLQAGSFIGSIASGGPVNAEILEIIPHCQGTHTESVAHVTAGSASAYTTAGGGAEAGAGLNDRSGMANSSLLSAVLMTLPATTVANTEERYHLGGVPEEPLLTRTALVQNLQLHEWLQHADAVIIRSQPNPLSKRNRNYAELPWYPVLTDAAIGYLSSLRLRHLLIDTPSLDRADDGGRVVNHKTWWGVQADGGIDHPQRLLTEMIYAHDGIKDGLYLLDMQISPLISDAVPSRPVIYPLIALTF